MDAGLSDFYHATQSKVYASVDRTRGRVTLVDGTYFFSPNCSRDMHSPPSMAKNLPDQINSAKESVESLHQPRWWSEEFVHLAFLDMSSVETGGFGWALHNQPSYKQGKDGFYYSDPQNILRMNRLQHDLRSAAKELLSTTGSPSPPEIIDNALHCTTRSRDSADVRRDNRRSREWFAYWLCRLSYAIAVIDSINFTKGVKHGADPNLGWFQHMADNSWHQAFLASVQTICTNFSFFTKRVGVILNLDEPLLNQFSVHWFCKYNIPVWFPYTPRTQRLRSVSPYVDSVSPSIEQLQAATPLIVHKPVSSFPDSRKKTSEFIRVPKAPSPERWSDDFPGHPATPPVSSPERWSDDFQARPATPLPATLDKQQEPVTFPPIQLSSEILEDNAERRGTDDMDIDVNVEVEREPAPSRPAVQPYVEFFKRMEERSRHIEEAESDEDKKRRLQRAKSGGLSKAKVYVWRKDHNDVYVRESVSKRFHQDTLCEYAEAQVRYNSFLNEYDCCSDFGEWEDEEIEDREAIYSHDYNQAETYHVPLASTSTTTIESQMDTRELHGEESIHGALEPGTIALQEVETLESIYILSEFMGFVPPVSPQHPASNFSWTAQDLKKYGFMIGTQQLEADFPESPFSAHARLFLEKMSSTDHASFPTPLEWDIYKECRAPVANSFWLRRVRILKRHDTGNNVYMFDADAEATLQWTIAVEDPAAALMACRWTGKDTDYELCRSLLGRGVAFRMLSPLSSHVPIAVESVPLIQRPLRLSGYQFSQYDYAAYVRERDAMFTDQNVVRRALKTGGIIWRLAVHLSFSTVLDGKPALADGTVKYVDEEDNGFFDDICTEEEMDKICGAYTCMQAHRAEAQIKMWWPTDKIWRTNTKFPFWTEVQERWFQDRHAGFEAGKAFPLTPTEYRDKLRRNSHLARISSKLNVKSREFMLNIARGGL
ncbi:hypothetical protein D9613_012862 [Agrocybe pediades]|uniref:Uncharacterized protein n=1 Tax=Agrocybe pediades TaxID=84607 RepID=A0A8H4QV11_9AGAR|nr:hypothetical protein D9613_012862 [Agrocybe pediades]